jgi:mono/diheme cytochrome c family protein
MVHGQKLAAVCGLLSLLGAVAGAARAAEPEDRGKQLYVKYCGACHGPGAKGDGIAGTFIRPKPPDLTLLARPHGGEFPLQQVVKAIDGREMPRAHGDPVMPVWGEILSEELGGSGGGAQPLAVERRVQGRILTIAEYLRTIQAK